MRIASHSRPEHLASPRVETEIERHVHGQHGAIGLTLARSRAWAGMIFTARSPAEEGTDPFDPIQHRDQQVPGRRRWLRQQPMSRHESRVGFLGDASSSCSSADPRPGNRRGRVVHQHPPRIGDREAHEIIRPRLRWIRAVAEASGSRGRCRFVEPREQERPRSQDRKELGAARPRRDGSSKHQRHRRHRGAQRSTGGGGNPRSGPAPEADAAARDGRAADAASNHSPRIAMPRDRRLTGSAIEASRALSTRLRMAVAIPVDAARRASARAKIVSVSVVGAC